MARIPVIFKNTVIYGFFNALNPLIPFFLLPILTRYLSPADYGILSVFSIFVFLATPFLRLETVIALRRFYFEHRPDFAADVGCSLAMTVVAFFGLCALWAAASLFTPTFFEVPMPWVLASLVVSLGGAFTTYLVGLYQIQGKALQVGTRSLLITSLVFIPTVILVVYFGFDWRGRTWTQLIVALAVEIPTSLYFIHRMFPFKFNLKREHMRDLLQFSLPLVPVTLASYLLLTTDRLVLNHFLTLEIVGVYTVAVQIASAVRIMLNAFGASWEAWLFGTLKEPTERNRARIVLVLYTFCICTLVAVLGLIFLLPAILPWLVGEKYTGAFQFLGWLAFAEMFKALTGVVQTFFLHKKKTALLNYILIIQAVVNFALGYFLIQHSGAIGVAQAALVASVAGMLISLFLVNRHYDLPWFRFVIILKPWQKGVRSGV